MIVRPYKPTDLNWIVGELKRFADHYKTKKSYFKDELTTECFVEEVAENHVLFVAEKDGELCGFISGFLYKHPFNTDIQMLAENFWWVSEEKRKSRAGAMLLNEFIKFGQEHCDQVTMTLENDSPVKDHHLEKKGFRLKERAFIMECE